jgi:hypothetical protein
LNRDHSAHSQRASLLLDDSPIELTALEAATEPPDDLAVGSHPAFACISKDFQRNCDQEGCYHGILDQCSFPASLSFEFRLSSQLFQRTCNKFILAQYTPVVSHVSMANVSTAES